MARPNIAMGNLNRLLASVLWPNFPALNISPSYLGPEAIDMAFEGSANTPLPTLTGVVNSPEPYQMVRLTLHLNRAQGFADLWKQQMELSAILGDCTVRPDTATVSPFTVNNTAIGGLERLGFAGRDNGFVVTITGTYNLNAALWA